MGRQDGDDQALDGDGVAAAVSEDTGTFVSLAGHFYRGEVDRMTAWRTRLDQTTNWAVVLMAAILTFAFSSPDNPHYVLLIGVLGVVAFLVIESQRYQEYDAWRTRVRIVQRYLLAGTFSPTEVPDDDWRDRLGADLREPELHYRRWQSLGHRLKRVYFFLLTVLLAAWISRVTVFEAGESWQQTAAIGGIPGPVVMAVVAVGYLVAGLLAGISVLESRRREFNDELPGDGD